MPTRVTVQREVLVPDPVKLARYERLPELGPRILFFSGGSALRSTSRRLVSFTHNSIHIITAFDSGGSSAKLRETFFMPAVGDIRARLMDLADQTLHGNPHIFSLFAHRLPKTNNREQLTDELDRMVKGRHRLIRNIPDPMRKIIRNHLRSFQERMPPEFDLRGASIGNLILTAGYLQNRRHLDPVIYIFSKLVQVRGIVRPVLNKYLHLAALLADNTMIVGQHRLTGKEAPPITVKIKDIFLTDNATAPTACATAIRPKLRKLISEAELICFPMGSFYSSLLANVLVGGVGRAVADNPCPKVYIPSTGVDPECCGMTLQEQIDRLLEALLNDAGGREPADVLNFVLLDSRNGVYIGAPDTEKLHALGIQCLDVRLVSPHSAPLIDERLLVPVLLSLA